MNIKRKLSIAAICITLTSIICFAPIVPVQAKVANGTSPIPPTLEHIIQYGNYSLAFTLQNFTANMEGLNVSAQSFTINTQTTTIANITTGYLVIDLQNVQATINNQYTISVGKATLNIDLYIEGGYIEYSFYTDTTSSIAELANNALSNII